MVMIDWHGSDAREVDGSSSLDLDCGGVGHPHVGRIGPVHMLDRFCHGVPFVLFRQGLFEGEKITPSKALLRRLSQEIGGVERWQGADFACAGMKRKTEPASLE